jgi:hypothetical protein
VISKPVVTSLKARIGFANRTKAVPRLHTIIVLRL